MHTGCCFYSVCFYLLLLLQLAGAVHLRVPDGKICCCGLLNLIPVLSFHSNTIDCLDAPWSYCCTYGLDFANYNTSSTISDIRGAKAGVSPPRRSPFVNTYM